MSSHLSNFQIVLTRAEKQQSNASCLFREAGITILDLPALEINAPNDWSFMDKALESLNSFDWLLLSSTNGVEALERRLTTIGYRLDTLPTNLKIASIGYKTSLALAKLGYMSDYIPPDFIADSLVTYFPASNIDVRILAIRVQDGGRTFLAEAFREAGIKFIEVPGYQSTCPKTFPKKTFEAFITQEVSAITFTSSKIVQHTCRLLEKLFGTSWREQLKSTAIISIGPQTTITCHKWLGRVDAEANPHNVEGLVTASLQVLNQRSPKFI